MNNDRILKAKTLRIITEGTDRLDAETKELVLSALESGEKMNTECNGLQVRFVVAGVVLDTVDAASFIDDEDTTLLEPRNPLVAPDDISELTGDA